MILKYKKQILILFVVILIIIGFIFYIVWTLTKPQTQLNPSPTPTQIPSTQSKSKPGSYPPIPGQGQKYQDSLKKLEPTMEVQIQRDALVGKLLNKLPYSGYNFVLSYDISLNQFIAVINIKNKEGGLKELDLFLKSNGILDRSWVRNLNTKYKEF